MKRRWLCYVERRMLDRMDPAFQDEWLSRGGDHRLRLLETYRSGERAASPEDRALLVDLAKATERNLESVHRTMLVAAGIAVAIMMIVVVVILLSFGASVAATLTTLVPLLLPVAVVKWVQHLERKKVSSVLVANSDVTSAGNELDWRAL